MLKIAQISDTHLGITTKDQLRTMFKNLAKEDFDILVHCGDWSGALEGYKKIKETLDMIRKIMPNKPLLATIGNHDYWCTSTKHPGPEDFSNNLTKIEELFREYKVHFLDKDGPYTHPDFNKYIFLGVSGWYNNPNPPTNDSCYLPIGLDGDTHRYLLKTIEGRLFNILDELNNYDASVHTMIFVSHFPVIKIKEDRLFNELSWSESLGEHIQDKYKCRYFLNGHAHQFHKGPLRYECGGDYFKPSYQIIEV